jgi:hypothetical protein
MTMPDPPVDPPDPGCDLACQTKIIINGGNAARLLDVACTAIEYMNAEQINKMNGKKIIEILNRMEDDAIEVQRLILTGTGYTGPLGKMMR